VSDNGGRSGDAGKTGADSLHRLAETTIAHIRPERRCILVGYAGSRRQAELRRALRHDPDRPPWSILDFGCGPGRDLAYFRSLGHEAVGLDGSEAFVEMAREFSGCQVLHQDFLALDLPEARFDGVFANASLFHVPREVLPDVLAKLHATLKPQGVLFSSNPRGNNEEGMAGGRYGCYHDLDAWRRYVGAARFVEIDHYYRPPGLPREQQPWLATVWRKA